MNADILKPTPRSRNHIYAYIPALRECNTAGKLLWGCGNIGYSVGI